jgi:hypothetical protein
MTSLSFSVLQNSHYMFIAKTRQMKMTFVSKPNIVNKLGVNFKFS